MNGATMFNVGDLIEYIADYQENETKLVGFVENVVDGKIGVRWLNNTGYYDAHLSVFTNPLDFLQKVDSIDERGEE